MDTFFYVAWIILLSIFSLVYVASPNPFTKRLTVKTHKVTFESANLSLDRIEKFTTWLTGLQTAAIGSIGFLMSDEDAKDGLLFYGFFSILFFGGSIILSTWILASLPSIQQRLIKSDYPSEQNDVYLQPIFSFVPFRMGRFTGLVHAYFLIGIVFFSVCIFKSLAI